MKVLDIFVACLLCCHFHNNKCFSLRVIEENSQPNDSNMHPLDVDSNVLAGLNRLLDRGKATDALQQIHVLSEAVMMQESIRLAYGRALIQTNQLREGENIIKEVLKRNSSSLDATLLLSKLYVNERRWDEAEKLINSILQQSPQNSKALALSSKMLLVRDNNIRASRSLMERAVRYSPHDCLLYFELGMIRFFDEDHIAGKIAFEESEELDNQNRNDDDDYTNLIDSVMIGKIFLHYKHTDWAAVQFEKVLNHHHHHVNNPPSTNVMLLLAECKDALGDHETALKLFEQIIQVEPYNAVAHAGIGLILLGTSNHNYAATHACGLSQSEALSHLELALQLQPDMKIVQDAITFCQLEISEAKIWRHILSNHDDDDDGSLENKIEKRNEIVSTKSTNYKSSSSFTSTTTTNNINIVSSLMNKLISKMFKNLFSKPRQFLLTTRLLIHSIASRVYQMFHVGISSSSSNSSSSSSRRRSSNTCNGNITPHGKNVCVNMSQDSRNGDKAQYSNDEDDDDDDDDVWSMIEKRKKIWSHREKTITSVPRVAVDSQQQFHQILRRHEPIIITNLQQNWGATSSTTITDDGDGDDSINNSSSTKISDTTTTSNNYSNNNQKIEANKSAFSKHNLEKMLGSHVVRVSVSESSRFDGPEDSALWGLQSSSSSSSSSSTSSSSSSYDVLVRPPQTSMLFGDFLSLVSTTRHRPSTTTTTTATAANHYHHHHHHHSDNDDKRETWRKLRETFYVEYLALHQYLGVDFLNLIPLPDFVPVEKTSKSNYHNHTSDTSTAASADSVSIPLKHLLTNIWIGGRPTTSPLHYDDYENLLSQIQGCKEVILYPPDEISNLYYISRPKATLKYKYPSTFIRDPTSIDKRGAAFVFGSSVNIDTPDYIRHPLYQRAKPIRAVLNAGDTLYLPAFWHHEVQSIPTTATAAAAMDNGEKNTATITYSDDDDVGIKSEERWNEEEEDLLNIAVNFWFANITKPPDSYVQ